MPQTQFFWLDLATNQPFNFIVDSTSLINPQYDETRTIIGGVYFNALTNTFSQLKRISGNASVWVFKNTNIVFSKQFTAADSITPLINQNPDSLHEITLSMSKFQPKELAHCPPTKEHFTLERISYLTLFERHQRRWVYTDTKAPTTEMQNVQLTQLSHVIRDEANQIIKCRLQRQNGTAVDLELITPSEQQKQTRFCVYQGTGIAISGSHLLSLVNKRYDEQGNLSYASSFIDDHLINLEYITQEQQKQRTQNLCLVYANTALLFPYNLKNMRGIQYNVAEKTFHFKNNNQAVILEYIDTVTLQQRKNNYVWVHLGTPNLIRLSLAQLPHKNMRMVNGNASMDIFIQENWYPIENISMSQLRTRSYEMNWVYAGTAIDIEVPIDLFDPANSHIKFQKNLVQKLPLDSKQQVFGEIISHQEKTDRHFKKRWYYANTRDIFKGTVGLMNSNLEFDQQGHLIRATIKMKDETIVLEYASIEHRRLFASKFWINQQTFEIIKDHQLLALAQVKYDEQQMPHSGLLPKNGTTILEDTPILFVTKRQMKFLQKPKSIPSTNQNKNTSKAEETPLPEKILVYANTAVLFEEDTPFITIESNSPENETRATAKRGERTIPLEYINQKTKQLRASHTWINLHTLKEFNDNEALANANDIKFDDKGIPTFATVQQDEKSIPLANYTHKMVTSLKTKIWVKNNTTQIIEDDIDLAHAKNIVYNSRGLPKSASITLQGKSVKILLLPPKKYNSLLNKVWVYTNSHQKFTNESELRKAEIQYDDQKKPIRAKLTIGKDIIHLEYILSAAQKFRGKQLWINCNTFTIERNNQILANLEQIKYDTNGNPISAFLKQNEQLIPFVYILDQTAYKLIQRVWVNEQTAQPITTKIDLANAQSVECNSQGIPKKALIRIEDKPVSIVSIYQDKMNDSRQVWVYANTGKTFPDPVIPEKVDSEYDDKGNLTKTTVLVQNTLVHLEHISTLSQSLRNKWIAIDPSTHCRVEHYLGLANAQNLCRDEYGNLLSASILLGNKTIPIKFVKKSDYIAPEAVWVYDYIHLFDNPSESFLKDNEQANVLHATINGQRTTVEKITLSTLHKRLKKAVWVHADSGAVVEKELLNNAQFTEYNILGYATKITVDKDSSEIKLISNIMISKHASNKRKHDNTNYEEEPLPKKPDLSQDAALLTLADTAIASASAESNLFRFFSPSRIPIQENTLNSELYPS